MQLFRSCVLLPRGAQTLQCSSNRPSQPIDIQLQIFARCNSGAASTCAANTSLDFDFEYKVRTNRPSPAPRRYDCFAVLGSVMPLRLASIWMHHKQQLYCCQKKYTNAPPLHCASATTRRKDSRARSSPRESTCNSISAAAIAADFVHIETHT